MVHVVLVCIAAMGDTATGAAVATAAQHDHFDQVQLACMIGHVYG